MRDLGGRTWLTLTCLEKRRNGVGDVSWKIEYDMIIGVFRGLG